MGDDTGGKSTCQQGGILFFGYFIRGSCQGVCSRSNVLQGVSECFYYTARLVCGMGSAASPLTTHVHLYCSTDVQLFPSALGLCRRLGHPLQHDIGNRDEQQRAVYRCSCAIDSIDLFCSMHGRI
eukprot:m.266124 g.266124  ORF g.266124 m.266124 type:complete len:125 (-) comp19718_c0_seq3:2046-2420(-)